MPAMKTIVEMIHLPLKCRHMEGLSFSGLDQSWQFPHTPNDEAGRSTSAKNISIWAAWLRQSGHALSEPSEAPQWRITPRPASIPPVVLHIALRSEFHNFFSLCRSPILNEHSGVVANRAHMSEWVHWVHSFIRIPMQWATL